MMTHEKHRNDDAVHCYRTCNSLKNVDAIEPYCREPICVCCTAKMGVDDIIIVRKSDWAALIGPITFPSKKA